MCVLYVLCDTYIHFSILACCIVLTMVVSEPTVFVHKLLYTYTTGSSALPDIYAQARGQQARGLVRIYQARHKYLWYKCYVPHYPCRLIARQYDMEIRIYHIDCLGKFDYGPAHASRNHRYTYVCQ